MRFLFDRDRLIDTTPSGEVLLSRLAVQVPSLKSVMDLLKPRFPDIGESIGALDHLGETRLLASDGSAQLTAVRIGETLRLDLQPLSTQESLLFVSAAELAALKAELERLRGVADSLPYLVWCEDRDGRLTWVNRAYLDTCNKFFGPDAADNWPLPRLFDTLPAPEGDDRVSARLRVGPEDSGDPFEVVVTPREGGLLGTAYPADSAVRAERSMRDVLQTLTRTFAQISIGLAVFGRDRRLVLFNPALADLTGLRPESLAIRPSLFEFLDLMRDRRMVPEPKDYKAWRTRLADAAARNMSGLCEHWTLPDGRTFKVTALPQPEGATALLFEDITGQVTRNRRFRGTVELQQILLDQRDEAIAVFAPDGTLALCNDAYEQLWQTDHGGSLEAVRLKDSLATWKAGCVPSPEWDSFPQAAAMAHGGWQAQLVMLDGRALFVQASALPGGHLSVEFRNSARGLKPDHPPPHRLQLLA